MRLVVSQYVGIDRGLLVRDLLIPGRLDRKFMDVGHARTQTPGVLEYDNRESAV